MTKTSNIQSRKTILVIEDDETSGFLLGEYFLKYNIGIIYQNNGKSGLRSFDIYRDVIELVMLDIRLPDIDGFSIYKELSAKNPSVPIIGMTALTLETKKKCVKWGFPEVLQKPIDFPDLDRIIQNYLCA